MADFAGWRVRLSFLWLAFPLCGNGLCKPLDSSLRWNDRGAGVGVFWNGKGIVKVANHLDLSSSSFRRRPESRKAIPGR